MKLELLYNFLKKSGFDDEVEILKSAAPIVDDGFMEMGDGGSVSVKRKTDSGDYNPDVDDVGGYSSDEWYESLGFVSDDIVVILYKNNLDSSFFKKAYDLFSVEGLHLKDLPEYDHEILGYLATGKARVLNDDFLKTFPEVRDHIESALLSKYSNASSEDIASKISKDLIIILAGSEGSGRLSKKSPYYLGHDLGHQVIDSDRQTDFLNKLLKVVESVANLYEYVDDYEESSGFRSPAIKDLVANVRDRAFAFGIARPLYYLMSKFFPTQNENYSDRYPDIFANFLKGDFKFNIPDYIEVDSRGYYSHGNTFKISESNKVKAAKIIQEFIDKNALHFGGKDKLESDVIDRLGDYVESIGDGSTPISYLKGKSILL